MPKKKKPAEKSPSRKRPAPKSKKPAAPVEFSGLERTILLSKGLGEADIGALIKLGIRCKADFVTVGDSRTLCGLVPMKPEVAEAVLDWALGARGTVVVEGGDVVNCVACGKRQPKDYKSGDLCVFCGKQAEPVFACYWCGGSGPGKFCRSCGATFVSPGELELAILLKRDGLSKEEIPVRLAALTPVEKQALWGRVHNRR
mgnify:CR=1 FL=1